MQLQTAPQTDKSTANYLPTYDANDLVQNGTQAYIILSDQTYTLRITRAGKLILTK